MKLLFFVFLSIAVVQATLYYHHPEDGRSLGNMTTLVQERCDIRQETPFHGKLWYFCSKKGLYAKMGRFNILGYPTASTNMRCFTTEDCMFPGDEGYVCVNIEGYVRSCYLDPYTNFMEHRMGPGMVVTDFIDTLTLFGFPILIVFVIFMAVENWRKKKYFPDVVDSEEEREKEEEIRKKEERDKKKRKKYI